MGPPRARPLPVQGSGSGASFSTPEATTASRPPHPPVLQVTTQNPTVFLPPGHSQASLSSPDLLLELQFHQPKHLPTYHGQSHQPARTVPLPSAEPASPNQKASACDTTASPATKNSVLLPVGVTTVGVFLPDLFQRQRSSSPPPDSLFRTPTADLHHYCHCPHAAPSGPLGTAAPATRRGTQPPAESRHSTVHSLLSSRSVVSDSLRPCGPQPVGVSRQEHGSGWLCPPPGDPPHPGTEATSLALAGGLFPAEPPGRPHQPQSLG